MLRGSEELGIYGDSKNSNKYPLYGLAGRVSVDPRCIIYWGNYGTGSLRIVLVSTNHNVSLGVDSGNRLSPNRYICTSLRSAPSIHRRADRCLA